MSKVIKACFVINDELNKRRNWTVEEIHPVDSHTESAEALIFETKMMLEELIAQTQQKADNMLLAAKEQAAEILAQSHAKSQEICDSAYQEGYQRGHQEATDKYEQEIINLHQASSTMLEKIQTERSRLFSSQDQEIIELVFVLVEKIVGTVIEGVPEAMGHIIEKLLEQLRENEKITIHVNPVHIPYLCGLDGFQVIEDPEIAHGDCQIITENGFIDAKINEQLLLLKQALLEEVSRNGN